MDTQKILDSIAKALGLEAGATPEQLARAVEALGALGGALAGESAEKIADVVAEAAPAAAEAAPEAAPAVDAADDATAPPAAPEAGGIAADPKAVELLALLQELSGGMDLASIFDAIKKTPQAFVDALGASAAGALPAGVSAMSRELDARDAAIKALTARLNEHEKRVADAALAARKLEVEAKVDGLVRCGRLLDGARDSMVALGLEAGEKFDALVATLAPHVPTQPLYASRAGAASTVALELGADEDKTLRAALARAGVKDVDGAVARHRERLNKRR